MLFLIDGHNLIPHLPGLSLHDLDDEQRLIAMLQEFSRARRASVHVYFDGAPPGHAGIRSFGRVKAHFVRAGLSADNAIRAHLRRLGASAREATVVSSDNQVRAEAASAQAARLDSAAFARQLHDTLANAAKRPDAQGAQDVVLSKDELDEWLKMFGGN